MGKGDKAIQKLTQKGRRPETGLRRGKEYKVNKGNKVRVGIKWSEL